MDANERKGWTEIIGADDLDNHMAKIEQAPVNAKLIKQMFQDHPLQKNGKLLIAGCGTGQLFDYIKPSDLGKLKLTLTDINQSYLSSAEQRLKRFSGTKYHLKIDEIEVTNLSENYDGILIALVLQHVEWKQALDSMIKLNPSKFYIIEQEQDPTQHFVTKNRKLSDAFKKYAEIANPQLVPRKELIDYLEKKGYKNVKFYERKVPDNKTMVGFIFQR